MNLCKHRTAWPRCIECHGATACCNGNGWYTSYSGGFAHPMPCEYCNSEGRLTFKPGGEWPEPALAAGSRVDFTHCIACDRPLAECVGHSAADLASAIETEGLGPKDESATAKPGRPKDRS